MSGKTGEYNYQLNFKMASRKDHKILLEEWEMPTKWCVQIRRGRARLQISRCSLKIHAAAMKHEKLMRT